MNRNNLNKRLIHNTLIYFISNFSTKILGFLLLPFYTAYLTPSDYGAVDLVFTAAQFVLPIITLQITNANFRYLFDATDQNQKCSVITNSGIVISVGSIILILFALPLAYYKQNAFLLLGAIYISTNAIAQFLQQSLRGIKRNIMFAALGVVSTAIQIACNIIFIAGLGMKSYSLLLAPIIANGTIIVISLIYKKFYTYFSIRYFDIALLKSLIYYSAPLVPDTLIWWFLSGFSRSYLSYIHGTDALGIYAIANKFSDIVILLYSIFSMAWVENAYISYKEEGRDEYFSDIFNILMKFLLSAIILGLPATRLMVLFMLGESFQTAYIYIPFLYIMVCINLFAMFYGSGFQCAKKTGGIMVSTCISSMVNVIVSLLVVTTLGVWGTVISMLCANVALLISRKVQSKKFFHIKTNRNNYWIFIPIVVFGILYYSENLILLITLSTIAIGIFCFINYTVIKSIIRLLCSK